VLVVWERMEIDTRCSSYHSRITSLSIQEECYCTSRSGHEQAEAAVLKFAVEDLGWLLRGRRRFRTR
jgi:hypothetical protein